jgi:hypothetical protein
MSPNLRTIDVIPQVPHDAFAARVRANLANRRPGMDELNPEALDLDADVLVALHRGLAGRQEALRGDRSGSLFRREIRGDAALDMADCRCVRVSLSELRRVQESRMNT